jgi:polar amino acid transport system substrate-binding protein
MNMKIRLKKSAVARWASVFAAVTMVSATGLANAQTLKEQYQAQGVTVGLAGYAPYGYKQIDGTFTGEQVEVVEYVLGQMGIDNIDYKVMDFGALIPGMVAGRLDMAAAGIYIRPKRCEAVLFSQPTFGQGAAYLVKKGNPKGLYNFKDIANTDGAVLAVLAGGTEYTLALKDGVPEDKLMQISDKAAGIAAVVAGRADGFALSALAIADIARTAGDLIGLESSGGITEIAGETYQGHGAIAFSKGQSEEELKAAQEFRDEFMVVLADYLGDGGGYSEMAASWGFSEAEKPSKTMPELCGSGL